MPLFRCIYLFLSIFFFLKVYLFFFIFFSRGWGLGLMPLFRCIIFGVEGGGLNTSF